VRAGLAPAQNRWPVFHRQRGRSVAPLPGGGTLGGVEPLLHRAADLRAAGYGDDDIRRLLRSGVLTPVRRGAYVEQAPDDRDVCHALLLRAALAELGRGAVASHVSAAVLHGLPTWGLPLERAHVTFDRRTGGRVDDRLHVHTAPLHADDVVMVDGAAVTSWPRTVVDILDTPRLGGGIRHGAEILGSYLDDHHPATLVEYGDRLGNRTVFKRLGYLVEALEQDHAELVAACRERVSAGRLIIS